MNRNRKVFKYIFLGFFVLVIACLIAWILSDNNNKSLVSNRPMIGVLATQVKLINWQPTHSAVGSFSAVQGIQVTSQVTGNVNAIMFHSGDHVKKGQVLLSLDQSFLHAQLKQQMIKEYLAKLNYKRMRLLFKKHVVSIATYDTVQTNYKEAKTMVEEIKAQLDKRTIKAPFKGVVGLREVSMGQLIQPGIVITNLQQVNPIELDFSIPQQYVSRSVIGKDITTKVNLDGVTKNYKGKITSIDSQLNQDTRTLLIRAEVENPIHELMPGMFGEVVMPLGDVRKVNVVPASSVLHTLYGTYIFKLERIQAERNSVYKAIQIPVVVQGTIDDKTVITGHFSAGDLVVKMGGFKLHSGAHVKVLSDHA